jgi:hypothetical protein
LEEDVPQQGYLISKIATLIEFLIGQGKQMTRVFVEAQATQFQSQRDDELRKKDGKVVFASRQTGNILNASTYGPSIREAGVTFSFQSATYFSIQGTRLIETNSRTNLAVCWMSRSHK